MTALQQIFDRIYDNDNKLCTRRSLFEQFKEVAREWLQQKKKEKELELRELKKKFPMIELTDKTPLDVELKLSEINVFLELLEDLDK